MSVRESIALAFKEVPYPGDDQIALHECERCRALRDDFRGKSPQALADEILERNCGDLALLSPAAFHYFVSAYMLYSLNHPDSEVASFTFMQFGRGGFDAIDLERFCLFNRQQKEAVIAYLGFFKSHEIEGDEQDNRDYQNNLNYVIKLWEELILNETSVPL
ncbi:MAG TPA: DUF6714 family protein [Verrucomicrobiae bacterium]|nr:DUF6714 family protein [Verrucomicrobiae bacterium]